MTKQKQVEEIAKIIRESYSKSPCTTDVAEALYNVGYRKTLTSDFASDTQKAYKEGYIKGVTDRDFEIDQLRDDYKRLRDEYMLYQLATDKRIAAEKKEAINEFAEQLKLRTYSTNDFTDRKWRRFVYIVDIDELLKEYEQ